MRKLRRTAAALFITLIMVAGLAPGQAQALPPEADKLIKEYEAFQTETKRKMEEELASKWSKLLADLQAIQDDLTKKADLDGALAVRQAINKLKITQKLKGKPILADPGTLIGYDKARPGEEVFVRVTGRTSGGSLWGTGLYTLDSNLGMAAVHAGVLKPGQESIVKVIFAPGQTSYSGSDQNGVRSSPWGAYQLSYKVEMVSP